MAFSPEDLAQLGDYIKTEVEKGIAERVDSAVSEATAAKPQVNDEPQNQPENQPER